MVTKITKEAVQKVHEQIFGNAFCVLGETRAECTPPGFPSLRTRLPFPEFTVKHCPPYTIIFNREHCTSQLGFLFEIDQTSVRQRVVVKFNSADFSLGVIPGDVVLSINDVDIQQQSVHDMNSKLSPNGPPEVKLVVVPSEESIEWSVRAIDIDPSCLFELQRLFSVSGDCTNRCYFDSLLKKQDGLLRRLNLRHWIKETGSFNLLNEIIRQVYLHVLRDSTSEHKSLCNVNDLVIVSHRDGYSLGSITEKFPDGTYQIHLSPGRQQLRVSLDDISRANAKKLEGIEDLMLMQHLNEPALVYNLHARFLTSLPYTYAGDFALIAFNPMRNLDIYDEFVKELFVKCENRLDMPPHIYSVAQTALANLKRAFIARRDFGAADECFEASGDERTCSITTDGVSAASTAPVKVPTQAICVLGRSGSGKSINTEHLVEYFFPQSAPGSEIDASKVRAVMCLLDAFTCSRTLLNSNASRCLRLFTIELIAEIHSDSSVQLNPSSLLIDLLLLDKFRVTRRPMGEPTFHIFYYFLAGLEDKARREYMLEDLSFPNLFMTPLQKPEDQSLAKSRWQAVTQAARVLGTGFEEVFNSCVCRLLAAIYHLGCAGATAPQAQTSTTRRFINLTAAERAAHLLGSASVDALTADVFGNEESPRTPSVSSGQSIQAMDSLASESASNLDLLGGFVANLYAIATTTLRDNINKALNSSSSVMRSASDINSPSRSARIFVVDPPGLQTPEDGGRVSGGSFEDLLYNYTNECLLQLYRDCQSQADDSGNISCSDLDFLAFFDNPPNNPCSSQRKALFTPRPTVLGANNSPRYSCSTPLSQSDDDFTATWNSSERGPVADSNTGLLWLLDYACSTGDMKTFIQLVAQKYVAHKQVHASRNSRLMRRLHRSGAFSLNHWNATAVVQYHPSTWLSSCHYLNSPRNAIELLQRSRLPALRGVGDSMDESASVSALSVSSSTGIVESFIFDTKYVVDILRTSSLGASNRNFAATRESILWVHCLLPVASAGLWQVASTPIASAVAAEVSGPSALVCLRNPSARFCVPLVRAQLHAISLATDLIYLKSAFTSRLQKSVANNGVVASPGYSVSEDITVTEASDLNNGDSKSSRKIEKAPVDSSSPSINEKNQNLNGSQQPISVASSALHSDAGINHTTNESSDTYNFVFNSTSNNLPWEQLLTLMPVDRGLVKQLRFQLEELEESKEALLRRQRVLSADLEECQQQLYKELREKRTAELRCQTALRQNSDLQCRVEELEEELEEATRKQRRSALANSVSPGFNPYANEVTQLIEERSAMREEIADLQERIAAATTEKSGAVDMELVCLKAKVHELEGRLELETSTKLRLQSTVDRLKTQLEHIIAERDKLLEAVQEERQNSRNLSRSLREAREDKERTERRLADEEHRRCETSNEVSSCVQEQFRLQQELSHLLLRCKQEEFRSMVLHGNGGVEDDEETVASDNEQAVDRFISHLSGVSEVKDASQAHVDDSSDLKRGPDFL